MLCTLPACSFGKSIEIDELEKKIDEISDRVGELNIRMERKLAELEGSINILLKLLELNTHNRESSALSSEAPVAVVPTPKIERLEPTAPVIEDNKIVNFSFEEGIGIGADTEAIVGWSQSGGRGQREFKHPRSGSVSMKLTGPVGKEDRSLSVFQNFSVKEGQTWHAGVYMRHNLVDALEEKNSANICLEFADSAGQILRKVECLDPLTAKSPTDIYLKRVVEGEAPRGSSMGRFKLIFLQENKFPSGAAWFDDAFLRRKDDN